MKERMAVLHAEEDMLMTLSATAAWIDTVYQVSCHGQRNSQFLARWPLELTELFSPVGAFFSANALCTKQIICYLASM